MTSPIVYLRAAGTSLAVDTRSAVCRIVHWGADLGVLTEMGLAALADSAVPARLNATPDDPLRFSLLPTGDDAWTGRPAVIVHRSGGELFPRLRLVSHTVTSSNAVFTMVDARSEVEVMIELKLDRHGILEVRRSARNLAATPLTVERLDAVMPIPSRAVEILDFTGAWIGERSPQRLPVVYGVHAREQRRGRTGHDASYMTLVGTSGFRNREGEVWAMHVAWSGNQGAFVERSTDGAGPFAVALSGGEFLRIGEVDLAAGEEYTAPSVLFCWSDQGIDGVSDRFHARLRARPNHPTTPRPLTLNTWEAVYLDHDAERLLELADRAAFVGVERFVLDDGWFHGRKTDHAGLGDWWVDFEKWPAGLHPLVERVREHGMQFGLWVEPEMINPDSNAAREHPEWLLTPPDGWLSRSQHVLNLAHPEAGAFVLERLDALINEYRIDFLKWDHNRDLLEAPAHHQTLATYRLIDELKRRHPDLEIESCASGGARVDLGILERTDRIWASDTNDPLERQRIQRWTSLLVPPELVGAHVAAEQAHTTGRVTTLGFRAATAVFGHSGIELDLTQSGDEELRALARFSATYRELRDLLHHGSVVHADLDDDAVQLHGVVAPDRGRAIYSWVQLARSATPQYGRVRFPGIAPDAEYLVSIRDDLGASERGMTSGPPWFDAAGQAPVRFPGSVLLYAGLPLPPLLPGTAVLIEFTRLPAEDSPAKVGREAGQWESQ